MRRILREAEETLEKLTAIKARLHEEYEHQVELAEGQNIGAKKRKVLAGLAIEEREQLRNIDKFLRSTLFPSTKRIEATAEGDADEEENTNENDGGGDKDADKTTDEQNKTSGQGQSRGQGTRGRDHHPGHGGAPCDRAGTKPRASPR